MLFFCARHKHPRCASSALDPRIDFENLYNQVSVLLNWKCLVHTYFTENWHISFDRTLLRKFPLKYSRLGSSQRDLRIRKRAYAIIYNMKPSPSCRLLNIAFLRFRAAKKKRRKGRVVFEVFKHYLVVWFLYAYFLFANFIFWESKKNWMFKIATKTIWIYAFHHIFSRIYLLLFF